MGVNRGRVRIIGGYWRSRVITFPEHSNLRPTPDRVRETLFNWLGQDLSGMSCLDLFAGSGALGFEAASRGAVCVVMIESDSGVFQALLKNRENLEAGQVELVQMDAFSFLDFDRRQFDVIFVDPPYRLALLPEILPYLLRRLTKDGLVYLETDQSWMHDERWRVWRTGKAGKVNFQLLELNGSG